ncbi:uncharacterized protein LOC127076596 isoform X4 [Lathyrus oleraceus]|uniref:uncharacterized protein LOC127076596 isoform X4 n=1 Tax=Pisum sativum TaxID=3888 RepID=UPI0021D12C82|nr:uncharacterized protein LOC127076596 isoform X4 [Pisum sativum]
MNEDNNKDDYFVERENMKNLVNEEPFTQGGHRRTNLDVLFDAIGQSGVGDAMDQSEGEEGGVGDAIDQSEGQINDVDDAMDQSGGHLDGADDAIDKDLYELQAKLHKGEEGVKTTTTTTLDVPNVVPAVDYVVADAVEEIEGGGNDSFAEKENSEVEKEVSDYEDEKEEEDEDDESENGADDPELETGLSLDDGFFEVEAIRRKRYRKGKLEYFVKWMGWEESANTWEPRDNLVALPDIVQAFEEGLKSTPHQKRKRKQSSNSAKLNKRVERSATPYSLRSIKTSTTHSKASISNSKPATPYSLRSIKTSTKNSKAANSNSKPATPLNEQPSIPDIPAFPQTVLFADEVENYGDGSSLEKVNHANDDMSVDPPEEVPQNKSDPKLTPNTEENESDDPKLTSNIEENKSDDPKLTSNIDENKSGDPKLTPNVEENKSDDPKLTPNIEENKSGRRLTRNNKKNKTGPKLTRNNKEIKSGPKLTRNNKEYKSDKLTPSIEENKSASKLTRNNKENKSDPKLTPNLEENKSDPKLTPNLEENKSDPKLTPNIEENKPDPKLTQNNNENKSDPKLTPNIEEKESDPKLTPNIEENKSDPKLTPNIEENKSDPKLTPNKEENESDPKLSELKATATNGNSAGNLAIQFEEAVTPPVKPHMNEQPNAVFTEAITKKTTGSAEPVQTGSARSGTRRRKTTAVKRFTRASLASKTGNAGVSDIAAPSSHTVTEPVKPGSDIVEIVKPVGYSAAEASTNQEASVTFKVKRSDGSEVIVDNNYLKTNHPILLIDYYEQHLQYSPKPS